MTMLRVAYDAQAMAVDSSADDVASSLDDIDQLIADLEVTWNSLPSVYLAPEAETVYGALAPVRPRMDRLRTDLRAGVRALRDYSDRLAAAGVRQRSIEEERSTVRDDDPLTPGSSNLALADLLLAADLAEADAECAAALRLLRRTSDSILVNAPDETTSEVGGGLIGLAGDVLHRYRGQVLGPVDVPEGALRGSPLRVLVDGKPMLLTQSGILIGEKNRLADLFPPPRQPRHRAGSAHRAQPMQITSKSPNVLMEPPGWVKGTGRVLGLLGAGLTLWGAYSTSYNDAARRHPDWTERQLRSEALVDTGAVGGASIAGGAVGGVLGAAGGAWLGTFILPGVGTVIGGIVGSMVGGTKLGEAAGDFAQGTADALRGDADAFGVVVDRDQQVCAVIPLSER